MARNFRLKVLGRNKHIIFKMYGDVDGASAALILRKFENFQDYPVILDFSEVRKCHPFGLNILKWAQRRGAVIKGLKNTGCT
jgi:hypothetical protein